MGTPAVAAGEAVDQLGVHPAAARRLPPGRLEGSSIRLGQPAMPEWLGDGGREAPLIVPRPAIPGGLAGFRLTNLSEIRESAPASESHIRLSKSAL